MGRHIVGKSTTCRSARILSGFLGLCLNIKMAGRCAPLGAQGVDTAYGLFV